MKVLGAISTRTIPWCLGISVATTMLAGCVYGDSGVSVTVVNECPKTVTVAVIETTLQWTESQARQAARDYGSVMVSGESGDFSVNPGAPYDLVAVLGRDDSLWFKVYVLEDLPQELVLSSEGGHCSE